MPAYSFLSTARPRLCRLPRFLCRGTEVGLKTTTVIGLMLCVSSYAQAALPESVQQALTRAQISDDDISMIITPIGDHGNSRLPPSVRVIDSTTQFRSEATHANTNDTTEASTSKTTSADQTAHTDDSDANLIIIEKRVITQQERALHAYTDDPYTHQSIEGASSIVPATPDSSAHTEAASSIQRAPLISHHPDTPRTPASTMKLIPSFVALDTLGADFVWQTRVYYSGLIINDRLYGDLIIQGSGDPKMTHERIEQLLWQVQHAGIRHISGDIILDGSIFQEVSKDPAAFDNAPLRPYNASPDGFLINFSSIAIKSQLTDQHHARLTYTPQLANYQLPGHINTRTAACGQARYSLAPNWQENKLTFNAALPIDCGTHVFYVAYPDAKDFAARVVAAKWQALGNTLDGHVIAQEAPYQPSKSALTTARQGFTKRPISALPLTSLPSAPLSEQIFDINHFSNNVMTEQVALSIGAYGNSVTSNSASTANDPSSQPPATSLYQFGPSHTTNDPKALATINQWWQTHLTTAPPHLTNGSGLCRTCSLTANNLNELLSYAYAHPSFSDYVASLGVAGVSGTISAHSTRLPSSAAIGRAWIKTGTLNNVTAMAGYVKGQSGQDYAVVGLINTDHKLNPYTARPVLDAMLDWTAQQ